MHTIFSVYELNIKTKWKNQSSSESLSIMFLSRSARGEHSIVKNTGGRLNSLRSGILVGKRYSGVLQKN